MQDYNSPLARREKIAGYAQTGFASLPQQAINRKNINR